MHDTNGNMIRALLISLLTVKSSEEVAIFPTSDWHLQKTIGLGNFLTYLCGGNLKYTWLKKIYQSTAVTSPLWPFIVIGSARGLFTWLTQLIKFIPMQKQIQINDRF